MEKTRSEDQIWSEAIKLAALVELIKGQQEGLTLSPTAALGLGEILEQILTKLKPRSS